MCVFGCACVCLKASEASLDSKQWRANLISDTVDRERYTRRELLTSWCACSTCLSIELELLSLCVAVIY